MKFLYKVWSKYDGFTPSDLPNRIRHGGYLTLTWGRYIETVEPESEIWMYFFGPHAFENRVYVKGIADDIDVAAGNVRLRILDPAPADGREDICRNRAGRCSARAPGIPARRVTSMLRRRAAWPPTADSCANRHCGSCPTWQALPRIAENALGWPELLSDDFEAFVPAYWVIPPRNFIHQSGHTIKAKYKRTSELFYRFKTGENRLTFALALGSRECLADRGLDDFDAIVPVPLSPDKMEAEEIHRTRLLATELGRLLDTPRREWLTLTEPTSKHVLQGQRGYNPAAVRGGV